MYRPDLVATFDQFVTDTVQEYLPRIQEQLAPDNGQSVPSAAPPAPAALEIQQFRETLEIELPAGSSGDTIRQEFRKAYLNAAQIKYPGAQGTGNLPSYVGSVEQVGTNGGYTRYRATLDGFIGVPDQ